MLVASGSCSWASTEIKVSTTLLIFLWIWLAYLPALHPLQAWLTAICSARACKVVSLIKNKKYLKIQQRCLLLLLAICTYLVPGPFPCKSISFMGFEIWVITDKYHQSCTNTLVIFLIELMMKKL